MRRIIGGQSCRTWNKDRRGGPCLDENFIFVVILLQGILGYVNCPIDNQRTESLDLECLDPSATIIWWGNF